MQNEQAPATTDLERVLLTALIEAQAYLDSYDTSAPSRVQAETRRIVTAAIATADKPARFNAETRRALASAQRTIVARVRTSNATLEGPQS